MTPGATQQRFVVGCIILPVLGNRGVPFHYLPVRPTGLSKALQLVVQQGTSLRTNRCLPASETLDGDSS